MGEPWLIVNYHHLYGKYSAPKMYLPSFIQLLHYCQPQLAGSWVVHLDLHDAFYSLLLPKQLKSVSSFRANGVTYQFASLPMGLFISLYILQMILNNILSQLHTVCDIFTWVHVDDIILIACSPQLCHTATVNLFHLLHSSDFNISCKKCALQPAQVIDYCSLQLDFWHMIFSVKQQILTKVVDMCNTGFK